MRYLDECVSTSRGSPIGWWLWLVANEYRPLHHPLTQAGAKGPALGPNHRVPEPEARVPSPECSGRLRARADPLFDPALDHLEDLTSVVLEHGKVAVPQDAAILQIDQLGFRPRLGQRLDDGLPVPPPSLGEQVHDRHVLQIGQRRPRRTALSYQRRRGALE